MFYIAWNRSSSSSILTGYVTITGLLSVYDLNPVWPFILFCLLILIFDDKSGGLIFKAGGSNMQHVTSLSFLLLVYSNYLSHANHFVPCGDKSATPALLKSLARRQVNLIVDHTILVCFKKNIYFVFLVLSLIKTYFYKVTKL